MSRNPDRYTSAYAKASGYAKLLPWTPFQRRVAKSMRKRRGGRGSASSSDLADVASALKNLGYSAGAVRSAVSRASGKDFGSLFRSAQAKVRRNPMATKKRKRKGKMPAALAAYWAKKQKQKNKRKKNYSVKRFISEFRRQRKGGSKGLNAIRKAHRTVKYNPKHKAKRRNRTIIKTRTKIVRKVVYRNPPKRRSKSALTFPVKLKSSLQKKKIASWLGRNFKRK